MIAFLPIKCQKKSPGPSLSLKILHQQVSQINKLASSDLRHQLLRDR